MFFTLSYIFRLTAEHCLALLFFFGGGREGILKRQNQQAKTSSKINSATSVQKLNKRVYKRENVEV